MAVTANAGMQSQKLTREQISDPYLVIDDLFDFVDLGEIKEIQWSWLRATVGKSYDRLSRTERSEILTLYEKFEALAEAVYVLHQEKKQQNKRKSTGRLKA